MQRLVLAAFARVRRPFAWTCLIGGALVFGSTLVGWLFKGQEAAAMFGSLLVFLDGWEKVANVEQDLDSEGAVDDD